MDISKDTLNWWNSQLDEHKYEAILHKDRTNIHDALKSLTKFVKNSKYIWANSPNFDCIILENAYKLCNLEIPWKFYNLRDTRTIYDLGNVSLKLIGKTQHHALYDCYNQILALNKALKNLKLIKNNSSQLF